MIVYFYWKHRFFSLKRLPLPATQPSARFMLLCKVFKWPLTLLQGASSPDCRARCSALMPDRALRRLWHLPSFVCAHSSSRWSSREPREESKIRPGAPGDLKQQGGWGFPLAVLPLAVPPGLPSSASLGALGLPQATLR